MYVSNLPELLRQHAALTAGAGLADFSGRTQLELTGGDRATFLHNFCTNEIRKLAPEHGCEAFITDAKGGILGFVYVFAGAESLVLETAPGQAEVLFSHLDRYIIREKVEVVDRTEDWTELLLSGTGATEVLRKAGASAVPDRAYAHNDVEFAGKPISLRRVPITGPDCFLLSVARNEVSRLRDALLVAGAEQCEAAAVEAARIESGTPIYGQDIGPKNLPQELVRDSSAISFTKGCYLGQETVARIDALGHVNKTFAGLRFAVDEVPVGTEILSGETTVGTITSAAFSPRLGTAIGLAYLRRGHNNPGTKLTTPLGEAEVIQLPLWNA